MESSEQAAVLEGTDTEKTYGVRLQTFNRSFEEICAGSDPWILLGNFTNTKDARGVAKQRS